MLCEAQGLYLLPFHHLSLSSPELVGDAPTDVRWTCLMLDLRSILSLYLNRHYSHLKSIKLCSSLLVKNLCTSDLVFDPGEELSVASHFSCDLSPVWMEP